MAWSEFKAKLAVIQNILQQRDPPLKLLFNSVTLDFEQLIKPPYVALIGAIIGQRIHYSTAKMVRANLYNRLGTNFTINDLEQLSDVELINLGLSEINLVTIRRLNQHLLTQQIELQTVDQIKAVKKIKGIGQWTITTTILTAMLDWNIFPCSDLFIRKRIQKLYKLPHLPNAHEVEIIAQKWAPYQGLVCWYLWRFF